MALFLNQNDNRTKLQQKIADDLAKKAKQAADAGDVDKDMSQNYQDGTKQTTSLAWAWVLIVLCFLVIGCWIIVT